MISLHFSLSLAPFDFVPLKLIVDPDVSADPSGRLGTSPDMVNPLLSPPGFYSFQKRLRGRRGLSK